MVGITTTIPLEIPLAAGESILDLNNLFVNHETPQELIDKAEMAGFPRNTCGWIKGIYGAIQNFDIRKVISVTEGDCSNTRALMEVLSSQGIKIIPFAYPFEHSEKALAGQIHSLAEQFQVDTAQIGKAKKHLDLIREKIHEIDRMTWQEDRVTGRENHYFQVCSSDMNGDLDRFSLEIDSFLAEAGQRQPLKEDLRLAYVGVPPIFPDLYPALEKLGARVVFNETQRQFTMPFPTADIVDQYLQYTYPYGIFFRLEDIKKELEKRRIDGVIHYVQSFCFRQIEDIVLRKNLSLPVLTLEGDQPAPLDARSLIRIECFLEMLRAAKGAS